MVDPADELFNTVEGQLPVCEEILDDPSVNLDVEHSSDPLDSSSFLEEAPGSLHSSSFAEESASQSLSQTEELSASMEDPAANSLTQLSSPESPTFTCGCKRIINGTPCSSQFSPQYCLKMMDNCAELLKNDLDNIIKGQIMAFTSLEEKTCSVSCHSSKEREKVLGTYYHQGLKICWRTFAHLHGIGKTLNMAINIFFLSPNVYRQRSAQ